MSFATVFLGLLSAALAVSCFRLGRENDQLRRSFGRAMAERFIANDDGTVTDRLTGRRTLDPWTRAMLERSGQG